MEPVEMTRSQCRLLSTRRATTLSWRTLLRSLGWQRSTKKRSSGPRAERVCAVSHVTQVDSSGWTPNRLRRRLSSSKCPPPLATSRVGMHQLCQVDIPPASNCCEIAENDAGGTGSAQGMAMERVE